MQVPAMGSGASLPQPTGEAAVDRIHSVIQSYKGLQYVGVNVA
ncbi:hypothetical protein KIPB_014370, partial [Kipferlia bialata]|eukprot:g14370.t1